MDNEELKENINDSIPEKELNTEEEENSNTDQEIEDKNSETEKEEEEKLSPEEELKQINDKLARTFAEMENQRRRFEKEKEDAYEYGGYSFAKEALNLLDNLERSKAALENDEKLNDEDKAQINEKLDTLKKAKESGNVADMKKAIEELNNSWSKVATKMYDGANQEGQQQEAPSNDDKKEKNKDEIEDADFEVVD